MYHRQGTRVIRLSRPIRSEKHSTKFREGKGEVAQARVIGYNEKRGHRVRVWVISYLLEPAGKDFQAEIFFVA
ncbi:MAG: hypothetical protein A3K22_02260 [Deltaproteobacteria bacterium RBG_16_42_7]|nr:MAG: hypothetical protein A3K22_02260 [Deltaproteobacteria bacterium RBG_16_42_7]